MGRIDAISFFYDQLHIPHPIYVCLWAAYVLTLSWILDFFFFKVFCI